MARGEYVYTVRSGGGLLDPAVPLAGFTVKRELRTWLSKRSGDSLARMKVYRMRDGGQGAVTEMSVTDILKGD